MSESGSDGLHLSGVLAVVDRKGDSSGDDDRRQMVVGGQGDHHRRQSFVAGGYSQDTATGRQGTDQTVEHHGGVVAIGQAVHHGRGALGAAVAGIADERSERDGFVSVEFASGRLHQQADFPVPGVITQRDGLAVLGTDSALGAQDEVLRAGQLFGGPAHSGILGHAEDVTAGPVPKHLGSQGE